MTPVLIALFCLGAVKFALIRRANKPSK
jgi:hypothetical protein